MIIDGNTIQNEYIKCLMDKSHIYMIEKYFYTMDLMEGKKVPFSLFPRQKDFLNALTQYRNNVTTKPRQAGITTTTAAFLACEMALCDPDSPITILVVGNKLTLSRQMVTKINDFLKQLPRWFWGDDYYSPDPKSKKNSIDIFTAQNKDEIHLFNGAKAIAISSGKSAARGVSSVNWLVFDEAAFIEDGLTVYSQAVATTSTGGHTIMISTPNGKDQLYYGIYNKAVKGENNFHVTELKWYQDPRYNRFLKWTRKNDETDELEVIDEPILDKKGNIEYNEKHWLDMIKKGYNPTSPWYSGMCDSFNNDSQKIAQELDVSFLGSSNNVVSPEYIDMQNELNVMEPVFKDPLVNETWIWREPIPNHRYILSCDPARGDGSDNSVIQIIDIDGTDENGMPILEQVLEYQGKMLADDLGELIYKYAMLYNEAFVVVECIGGVGDAAILMLQRLKYKNLYYDDPSLTKVTFESNASSIKKDNDGKLPGFHTNSARFSMLSAFARMVKTNEFKIRSKRTTMELETWIYDGKGRMDHMSGMHDDTITCLAMGLFVMRFSYEKRIEEVARDKAMINSWFVARTNSPSPTVPTNMPIDKQMATFIFAQGINYKPKIEKAKKAETEKKVNGPFMWLMCKRI